MTVIAWDGKILAADKQINCGHSKYIGSKIKKLKNGDVLAWTGTLDAGLILAGWYEEGCNKDVFPFNVEDDALTDLIVATKKGVIKTYCQSVYPIIIESPFLAWGSGRDLAMGAMECGADAIHAVEVANIHCNSCGMGVDFFKIR